MVLPLRPGRSLRRRLVLALVPLLAIALNVATPSAGFAGTLSLGPPSVGYEEVTLAGVDVRYTSTQVTIVLEVRGNAYDYLNGYIDANADNAPDDFVGGAWATGPGSAFDPDSSCAHNGSTQAVPGGERVTLTVNSTCAGYPQPLRFNFEAVSDSGGMGERRSYSPGEEIWSSAVTPEPVNLVAPTISGTPAVGATLTAGPGTWEPAGLPPAYQWLVGGSAVAGATSATYVPSAADLGKGVAVRVTMTELTFVGSATSASTSAVTGPTLVQSTPGKIKGKLKVGKTVTADPGTWNPPGVTVQYQWFAKKAGKKSYAKLAGATKAKLKLGASLKGAALKVKLVVSAPGYPSSKVTLKKKGKVKG